MPVYATIDDYTEYTGEPLPTVDEWALHAGTSSPVELPPRIFIRASLAIDKALVGARYEVDDDGLPTDADLVTALKEATCAQARLLVKEYIHHQKMANCPPDPKMKALMMAWPKMDDGLATEAYDILRSARLLPVRHLRMRG
jgi:hypothetical protein